MRQMLSSALFAGVAAGLIAALLQFLLLQPDIALAERYETGELQHFAGVEHDHASHDHAATEADEGAGAAVAKRHGLTVLFSILNWCGFGLVLSGVMRLVVAPGDEFGEAQAALWGLAGFATFQLMPALGLAPELPGMSAGDLQGRQLWWLVTVLATGAGIWTLAYGGVYRLAGLVLLAAPHAWGAPEPVAFDGIIPPELASGFTARSLGVGMVTWVSLGLLLRHFWRRERLA